MAEKKLAVVFTTDTSAARKGVAELNSALGTAETQAQKTGSVLKSALGGVALAAGIKFATDAAGDLAEAQAKNNSVFGESVGVINQFADEATSALALSRREALEATGTFGNMFTQLGAGEAKAADMSKAMITLAGDFAAYHNANPVDVIEAQTAAFRGEYDALQKFVPTINAAAVQQRAMADTGKANAASLSAMEKAQATYNIMLENAGAAQGAAAREADGLAMSNKRARAEIENAAASVGGVMLPAAAGLAGAVGDLAGAISLLPQPVQTTALGAIVAAAAWSRWGDSLGGLAKRATATGRTISEGLDGVAATRGITKTQAATEALKSSMAGAVGPSGRMQQALGGISVGAAAAGFAMVGLGAILYAWQDERAKDAQRAKELAAAIGTISDEAVRTGATVESVFASSVLPDSLGVTSGLFQQTGVDVGELNAALVAGGETWNAYAQSAIAAAGGMETANGKKLAAEFRDLQDQLAGSRVATDAQREALAELGMTIDPVTGETVTLTQAIDGATKAQGRAEAAARRTATAWADLGTSGANAFRGLGAGIDFAEQAAAAYTQRALGVFEANQAYSDSTQALTAHQREAAEAQERNADTARQNADAIRQHAEAVQQAADQVASASASQADARESLAEVEVEAQEALAQAWADTQPTAEAMVQAANRVAEAEEQTTVTAEASRVAREGLNQALVAGAQYLRDLAEAQDDSNRSVERAQLAYDKAVAARAELATKPSDDPFAAREAALREAEALDALEDAQRRAAEATDERTAADAAGVEGTPVVISAREAIAAAAEAEAEANARLADATRSQAETQQAAVVRLAEVQEETSARISDAQDRVSEATAALNEAQTNLATTQATGVQLTQAEAVEQTNLGAEILANAQAKLRLAEAEAIANGHTLTAAESAAILRAGLDEGRVATGFWSTELETLGTNLDYAARSRVVELDTAGALERARELGYKVETLPNGHIRVTADTSQADGALDALGMKIGALGAQLTGNLGAVVAIAVGGYARGGDVRKGETAIVGEEGPELVTFGADGYVTDAARTRAMLSSSTMGAGTAMAAAHGVAPTYVTIEIKGHVLDGRELGRLAAEGLNQYGASQNGPILVDGLVRR